MLSLIHGRRCTPVNAAGFHRLRELVVRREQPKRVRFGRCKVDLMLFGLISPSFFRFVAAAGVGFLWYSAAAVSKIQSQEPECSLRPGHRRTISKFSYARPSTGRARVSVGVVLEH